MGAAPGAGPEGKQAAPRTTVRGGGAGLTKVSLRKTTLHHPVGLCELSPGTFLLKSLPNQ